jgi:hypothetical protein
MATIAVTLAVFAEFNGFNAAAMRTPGMTFFLPLLNPFFN